MEIKYVLRYREEVLDQDLPSFSHEVRSVMKAQIEKKLTSYPELFGKPLRNILAGFRSLQVGDYRVIYKVSHVTVIIAVIQHRGKAYVIAEKRLS